MPIEPIISIAIHLNLAHKCVLAIVFAEHHHSLNVAPDSLAGSDGLQFVSGRELGRCDILAS